MIKPCFIIGFIVLVLIFGSSCQKELSSDVLNDTINHSSTVLHRIKIDHTSATDPFSAVLSIQIDTPGRKLNVYLDDTTTSSPFDLLAVIYQFDANGYLISSNSIDFNGTVLSPDFTITRNNNGQIQKIIDFDAEEINGIPYNDTIYYSYHPTGSQTMIQDSSRYYSSTGFATRQTVYNPQNQVVTQNYLGWNLFTYK